MKKLFSLLLILILLLAVSGCGKSEPLVGTGTEDDPYRISTADQLFQMAKLINGEDTAGDYRESHYLITADIDLGGKKWEPIAFFRGVLDGGNHTVSNFRISNGNLLYVGFFSDVSGGTVKNLTVSDATISGSSDSAQVAAIAGSCLRGFMENCHTTETVTVTSTYSAAGICNFYNTDNVLDCCTNAATVISEKSQVGTACGVVRNAGGLVSNCVNTGTITSDGEAAGIAGSANGGLFCCTNSGTVTARDNAAGIVISFDDGALNSSQNNAGIQLDNCVNSGAITSTEKLAGGIAVSCRTGSIVNCVNSGSVSAPDGAGGIFNYFQRSAFGTPATSFTVSGCTNSGTVTVTAAAGNNPVGGIGCQIMGSSAITFLFEDCTNSGTLLTTGQTDVADSTGPAGGIIGDCSADSITFRNCSNSGAITGVRNVGGIVGQAEMVDPDQLEGTLFLAENCSNSGPLYAVDAGGLTTEIYCGGIVGNNARYWNERWITFETLTYEGCSNTGTLSGDTGRVPLLTHEICGSCTNTAE